VGEPVVSDSPISNRILGELPKRLHWNAERYYFAGILLTINFDAANVVAQKPRDPRVAAMAALTGPNKIDTLVGPDIVNFSFSIELYLKLLRFMADGRHVRGHSLEKLFVDLEGVAHDAAIAIVQNHRHARGDRDEFLSNLVDVSDAFAEWRYSHEKEFVVSSPDTLMSIADALRDTVRQCHPGLKSQFVR
jgi:hypothetical protein